MKLKFKGGQELIYLELDRTKKKAMIATSKNFYKLQPVEWKMLFDKGKEEEQEQLTDGLNDKKFRMSLILAMAQKGYVYEK